MTPRHSPLRAAPRTIAVVFLVLTTAAVRARFIYLKSGLIDTHTVPEFDRDREFRWGRADSPEQIYPFLVHASGPRAHEQIRSRLPGGNESVAIPKDTWLVSATVAEISEARRALSHGEVPWIGYMHPRYKISRMISAGNASTLAEVRALDVDLVPRAQHRALVAHRVRRGPRVRAARESIHRLAYRLASDPCVTSVDVAGTLKPTVEFAVPVVYGITQNISAVEWPWGDGTGHVVGVADTGIYTAHVAFDDAAAIQSYWNYADSRDDDGHGTHVVSSLLGRSEHIRGSAPGARVAFIDIDANGLLTYPGTDAMLQYAYDRGARIFSFSYGTSYNSYDSYARDFDAWISDHPDMLVFISAGNDGPVAQSVGSLANAKNIVAVGATRTTRDGFVNALDFYDPPVDPGDRQAAAQAYMTRPGWTPDTVAWFSSRGPTLDQRLKPDIVTPGEAIVAADALGGTIYGRVTMQGTSMATPIAAGIGLLIREYLLQTVGPSIDAALVKAVLLLSGRDVAMAAASKDDPNVLSPASTMDRGHGRANLSALLDETLLVIPRGAPMMTSGSAWRECYIAREDGDVRTILVWTDPPPASSGGLALVNDIDLTVTRCDGTVLAESKSRLDNVESVSFSVQNGDCVCFWAEAYSIPEPGQTLAWASLGPRFEAAETPPLPSPTPTSPPPPEPTPTSTPDPSEPTPTATPIIPWPPVSSAQRGAVTTLSRALLSAMAAAAMLVIMRFNVL